MDNLSCVPVANLLSSHSLASKSLAELLVSTDQKLQKGIIYRVLLTNST